MICRPITIRGWYSGRAGIAGLWSMARSPSRRVRIPRHTRESWYAALPRLANNSGRTKSERDRREARATNTCRFSLASSVPTSPVGYEVAYGVRAAATRLEYQVNYNLRSTVRRNGKCSPCSTRQQSDEPVLDIKIRIRFWL